MPLDAPLNTPDPDEPRPFPMTGALYLADVLREALQLAKLRDKHAGRTDGHHVRVLLDTLVWWAGYVGKESIDSTPAVVEWRRRNAGRRFEPVLFSTSDVEPMPSLRPVPGPDEPVQGPQPLRSVCAHTRSWSMGAELAGRLCGVPIVQHVHNEPWVHAGNAVDATLAGRDHGAVYRNDCNLCPASNPFYMESTGHLLDHQRDEHDVDTSGLDGWWDSDNRAEDDPEWQA